jgi:enhancing lycopene biosynthesis protein 2
MSAEKKHVGVVLAGCGYLDGAEIHEATLTLLSLDRAGAKAVAMAPDVAQAKVIDHVTNEPVAGERRRVLAEAARIARGQIRAIGSVHATELDALIFTGGFGAAMNLCTFAADGKAMTVEPHVARLIGEMQAAKKPMGFMCIAPVIAAKVLGSHHPRLTIGSDRETAAALEAMGSVHVDCPVDGIVVDERLKLVSTPAYMLGPSIAPVAAGIDKLVGWIVAALN